MHIDRDLPFVLEGYVEGVSKQAYCGWIWCVGHPQVKPIVHITIDGHFTCQGVAREFRGDLLSDGKSDGNAAYVIPLPLEVLDDRDHEITLRWEVLFGGEVYSGIIQSTSLILASPAGGEEAVAEPAPREIPASPHSPIVLEGYFDGVHERTVTGWTWCVEHPQLKPTVEILIDGQSVGSVVASDYRADLHDDGKSDGCVAYSFVLPADLLDGQTHAVELAWSAPLDGQVYRGPLLRKPLQIQLPKAMPALDQWLVRRQLGPLVEGAQDIVRGAELVSVPQTAGTLALLSRQQPVTIIVHVDDRCELVEACLDALVEHTSFPSQLVIVDDGTKDPRIQERIARLKAETGNVQVWRNRQPIGYATSVDNAIARTTGDVVLVRSTVRVTPRWLQGLVRAAAHAADIGVVAPLSGCVAWLGLDESAGGNGAMARQVTRGSERLLPINPGFPSECLFLRRAAIDDVGTFATPDGLEAGQRVEVEFCLHAAEAGWSSVWADDVFVIDSASPATPADEPNHPAHQLRMERAASSDAYAMVVRSVARAAEQRHETLRPRLLYVLSPPDNSGTPMISLSLARQIRHIYDTWFVWGDGDRISLAVLNDKGEITQVASWKVNGGLAPWDLRRGDVDAVLFKILRDFDIELVHCRQVVQLGLSVTRAAHALGIPVVLSFHDFYLICPTVTLLDGEGRFCAGDCRKGSGDCRSYFIPEHSLTLRDGWTPEWQQHVASMFRFVDAFVTTTPSAYDVLTGVYPDLQDRDFRIIEHGRTFSERHSIATAPGPDRPIKVLALGNYNDAKGLQTVLALAGLDREERVEIHWLGAVPGGRRTVTSGVYHGAYQLGEAVTKIREIAPDFVVLLSTWAETYCHTLSEAWAAGIPVLGSRLGAIGARITAHGGGWAVDPHDAAALLDLIAHLSAHPEEYRAVAKQIPDIPIRTTEDMAADYLTLYADILRRQIALVQAR